MIYILASAAADENNTLEVKSIYITDERESYILTKRNEFAPAPSKLTKLMMFGMSTRQPYSMTNLMYSTLRELNDNMEAISVASFLEGKIDTIRGNPDFDSHIFDIINTFGVEVKHV